MPDYSSYDSYQRAPSNIDAEQALLGALLANNRSAYDRVSDFLLPEHFADPIHGRIYKAIAARSEKGLVADAVTLKAEFENSGELDDVGGTAYLARLLTSMVGIINASDYGRAVHDAWLRRGLIAAGTEIVNRAQGSGAELDAVKQVEIAEQALFGLMSGNVADNGPVSIKDAVRLAIEEGQLAREGKGDRATSTGFASLDRRILGLRSGHLLILAGRPGMGKSCLAKNVAVNVACGLGATEDGEVIDDQSYGLPVMCVSLEETATDFGASAVSRIAGVSIEKILTGDLNTDEASRVITAQKRYESAPLFVFDKPRQSVRQVATNARRLRRKYGKMGLIVVDYLQLMPDPAGIKDKRLAVGDNAKSLKELAKEIGCPVLLLSQLARRVEERTDKRPMMSDLRETGEIEDAADAIMLLYREEYYYRQTVPKSGDDDGLPSCAEAALKAWHDGLDRIAGKAEVIVPKVRRAEAGVVHLGFNGAASRFEETP